MRRGPGLLACLCVIAWAAPWTAAARAASGPNAPVEHGVYRFLERLDALGLVDSRLGGIRPFAREEVARLLIEASDRMDADPASGSEVLREELALYRRDFRASVADLTGLEDASPSDWWKPLQSLGLRYTYLDGEVPPEADLGRSVTRGGTWIASADTHAGFLDFLTLHLAAELVYNEDHHPETGGDELAFRLPQAYLKMTVWNFEILGGMESMAWGPPGHDSLLMSANAEPFRLLKVTNPLPVLLPWIFSALGPLRYELFFTELGSDRPVPRPFLAGVRLDLRPLPWLELGFSRTFLFDGKTVEKPGGSEMWRILAGYEEARRAKDPDVADQRAGLDLRLRVPVAGMGVVVYGEAFGENVTNLLPYRWSWRAGLHLAGLLLPDRTLDLRAEWTRTNRGAYAHPIWSGGYAYEGRPLGHHAGGWAEDVWIELSWIPAAGVRARFSCDWELRRTEDPAERTWERLLWEGRLAWAPAWLRGLTLSGAVRFARHRNRLHRPGDDGEELTLTIEVRHEF